MSGGGRCDSRTVAPDSGTVAPDSERHDSGQNDCGAQTASRTTVGGELRRGWGEGWG